MIKIVSTEYAMVGPGQVSIRVAYEVESHGAGKPIRFAADLYGGPYTYAFLRGAVDDYAGCLAKHGYDAGMADDLRVYQGALEYLQEHGEIGAYLTV